ncbi:MAG: haloacid dehalogenase type II [Chloroflexota bacterium]|nr:haloacid dehalogenase type II [Chloroflexota bacterium]
MDDRRTIDFGRIEVLTFDCYGTLIDWEAGIAAALRGVLGTATNRLSDDELLALYGAEEAAIEGGRWLPYRAVLAHTVTAVGRRIGRTPTAGEAADFAASIGEWPPFPDSVDSLRRLGGRFALGVITNCDDDLFAASNRHLGEPFRWVITAERAGAYKPSLRNFALALKAIGRPADRIMHVAQSLYHDHVPAAACGLATAWIDRRRGRPGSGATPPAVASPDITSPDLAGFAELALAA